MGTGTHSTSTKTFLTVAYGKLRQRQLENGQKVNENTPNAVKRESKTGESWALEYDYIEGRIDKMYFKEDKQFGNSYEIIISDAIDLYQISFREGDRTTADFLCKLPNINLKNVIKITVYDFTNKEGKTVKGTSIIQNNEKILSFYNVKVEDTWKNLHGYPSSQNVDFKDSDELKIYQISVNKFLRNEFISKFTITQKEAEEKETAPENVAPEEDTDLPF